MHIFAPNISDQQQLDTQCTFCDYSAALHSHIALHNHHSGTRTHNILFRKQALCPFELRDATAAGFEPATHRLEGDCSVQLSYAVKLVVTAGFEPTPSRV